MAHIFNLTYDLSLIVLNEHAEVEGQGSPCSWISIRHSSVHDHRDDCWRMSRDGYSCTIVGEQYLNWSAMKHFGMPVELFSHPICSITWCFSYHQYHWRWPHIFLLDHWFHPQLNCLMVTPNFLIFIFMGEKFWTEEQASILVNSWTWYILNVVFFQDPSQRRKRYIK